MMAPYFQNCFFSGLNRNDSAKSTPPKDSGCAAAVAVHARIYLTSGSRDDHTGTRRTGATGRGCPKRGWAFRRISKNGGVKFAFVKFIGNTHPPTRPTPHPQRASTKSVFFFRLFIFLERRLFLLSKICHHSAHPFFKSKRQRRACT